MNHLYQRTISDTEIVLNDENHDYLGPNLILERCKVVLRTSARGLTLNTVKFIDCKIEAKKKLSNFQLWSEALLKNCYFSGNFSGNDFGHFDSLNGNVENCDFSNATLFGCRFIDCDIDAIKLPEWPCFTLLRPHDFLEKLGEKAGQGPLTSWLLGLSWGPKATVAIVEHAPSLAKELGVSENELIASLKELQVV